MSYLSISKMIRMLSKLEGSKGAWSPGRKQLDLLTKDTEMAQIVGRMKDPQLDVAYKAQSNYNIAAFRFRDGEEVVAKGAVSLQNPGTTESIIKYRLSVGENGRIIQSNGHVDFGKQLAVDDLGAAVSRRKGVVSAEADSGKAFREAIKLNEEETVKLVSRYTGESEDAIKTKVYSRLSYMANKLQKKWKELGHAISGGAKSSTPVAEVSANTIKKVTPDAKTKALNYGFDMDLNAALAHLKKLSKEDFGEFEKVRKEMGKYGFQPYFHPKTDELKIMEGVKSMEEVAKKLKGQGIIKDVPKTSQGKIKRPEIKSIEDFINENPGKLKLDELNSVKHSYQGLKEKMARIQSKFAETTDEAEKIKLASEYNDYAMDIKKYEEIIAKLTKEL